jgi:hypothetical protein
MHSCNIQVVYLQEATVILAMLLSRFELAPVPGAPPVRPAMAVILETEGLAVACRPLSPRN